jgi:hypothetical protein
MEEHESWLFLEIGEGRAPDGRGAYLIHWPIWLRIEAELEEQGFSSVIWKETERSRNPSVQVMFGNERLVWNDGDWAIPGDHLFWKMHPNIKEPALVRWNNDERAVLANDPTEA